MAAQQYDAIVVGGGHNGLVASAYLAREGAKVLLLEKRYKTGGAAATDAPWPEAPEIELPGWQAARAAIADKKRTGPIRGRFTDRFSERPAWASRSTQEKP